MRPLAQQAAALASWRGTQSSRPGGKVRGRRAPTVRGGRAARHWPPSPPSLGTLSEKLGGLHVLLGVAICRNT